MELCLRIVLHALLLLIPGIGGSIYKGSSDFENMGRMTRVEILSLDFSLARNSRLEICSHLFVIGCRGFLCFVFFGYAKKVRKERFPTSVTE